MKLTILQQNDTHGYLEPHPEFFWHAGRPIYRTAGGYARISGYVQQVRKDTDHVLYVDGGDVFHGTGPLVKSQGEIMIDILNHLRLDAMVPGNWDFAYGPHQLRKLAGSLHFPLLACNVHGKKTPFAAYAIKEYPGCRVGLIGLAYPHLEETMPPSFAGNFNFTHGVEELSEWIPRLRSEEKADLIVVLSHTGLPLDVKLAGLVSGIDILLSGHSHDRIERPIRTNGTLIVQSGASGSFIGRLDIELEFGRIARFQHRLVTLLEADYPLDPDMQTLIDAHLSPYRSEMMEVVGQLATPLHRMTLNEAPMDRIITDSYILATGADIAFSHGWRYGAPVLPGQVTLRDLYNIIPTNPRLFTLEMEGMDILKALETNLEQVFAADPFDQKGGYLLRSSNLSMAFKPYNPAGERIQHIEIGGSPLKLSKRYKVAGAGEQVLKKYTEGRRVLDTDAFGAIRAQFAEHPEGLIVNESSYIHFI